MSRYKRSDTICSGIMITIFAVGSVIVVISKECTKPVGYTMLGVGFGVSLMKIGQFIRDKRL